jgi:hypothetical protein
MWLEATAWVWAPALAILGTWAVWRIAALGREVRGLANRIAELEAANGEAAERNRRGAA